MVVLCVRGDRDRPPSGRSQAEEAEARLHRLENRLLLGLVVLSLGEIAYAIYQTCLLIAEIYLRNTVVASAR